MSLKYKKMRITALLVISIYSFRLGCNSGGPPRVFLYDAGDEPSTSLTPNLKPSSAPMSAWPDKAIISWELYKVEITLPVNCGDSNFLTCASFSGSLLRKTRERSVSRRPIQIDIAATLYGLSS